MKENEKGKTIMIINSFRLNTKNALLFQCELGKFVSIGIGAEDERKQVADAIFPVDPKE
ncbi:hypothetical protein [Treponema pedis]|uniref:Uncharacterized protein n=1 Tax=Treponema pedis TaxID=409322 RepID=A0A7S6WP59_9SPIR|nr:hypothetical protein [Treponema pedis]QOW60749.1 hypothetical protein IFE08_13330 [Treponema pedis]